MDAMNSAPRLAGPSGGLLSPGGQSVGRAREAQKQFKRPNKHIKQCKYHHFYKRNKVPIMDLPTGAHSRNLAR
jgi:hypothetical protein